MDDLAIRKPERIQMKTGSFVAAKRDFLGDIGSMGCTEFMKELFGIRAGNRRFLRLVIDILPGAQEQTIGFHPLRVDKAQVRRVDGFDGIGLSGIRSHQVCG